MSELDNDIGTVTSIAPLRAITALDENPDDGARAVQLARSTGVPASIIHGDLDGFVNEQRSAVTASIVRRNSHIADYINNHPLADVISNDDYHNLDEFSQKAGFWGGMGQEALNNWRTLWGGAKGATEGAAEGFGSQRLGSWLDQVFPEFSGRAPYSAALISMMTGAEPVYRALGAGVGAMTGAVSGAVRASVSQRTDDQSYIDRAARDAGGIVESELGRGGSHVGEGSSALAAGKLKNEFTKVDQFRQASADVSTGNKMGQLQEAMLAGKPWIENGIEPPRGVHPMLDQMKAKLNAERIDQIDDMLAAAIKSQTRERDPEYFKHFVDSHPALSDASVSIAGERVAKLYGDKVPEPDDNVLGWVPGIEAQVEAARNFGTDVHVPLRDWYSRVDPELAKELHDDLRAWPGGITKTEAEEKIEPKPVVDSPLAQVRDAGALEPAFSIGDRKLTLKAIEHQYDPSWHEYHMLDQNGKVVGELSILPDMAKKQLYVGNISGLAGLYSNSFGPSLIRDLLKRQLKELYPDFETVTGHRVSGAREVSGVTDDLTKAMPVIKLNMTEYKKIIEDYNNGKTLFRDAYTKQFGLGVEGWVLPKRFFTEHELALNTIVRDELARIAPTADLTPTAGINMEGIGRVEGVHLSEPSGTISHILIDLLGRDSLGTARHEAIHHLYRAGLFDANEWAGLQKASEAEDWVGRYRIRERYGDLSNELLHEEAIAEAYRDWAKTKDSVEHPATPVTSAFQKIWDFLQRIKERFATILGKEPNADELFTRVHTGEVGARGLEGDADYQSGVAASIAANDDKFVGKGKIENEINTIQSRIKYREDLLSGETKPGGYSSETAKFLAARDLQNALKEIEALKQQLEAKQNELANYQEPITSVDEATRTQKYPGATVAFSIPDHFSNLRAEVAGLDKRHAKILEDLTEKQHQEDLAAAVKRAEKEQKRQQTKEWKSNYADVRKEVEASIRQRPDVAADLLIGSGELQGQKLRQVYPLRAEDLTAEQKAALPKRYYSKDGLPVDMVANTLGFTSGDVMVQKLAEYQLAKGDLSPQEMVKQTIDEETQRQMEAKYGNLDDNIMREAQDQAVSETGQQRILEEWQGAAMQAGQGAIDKELAKTEALRIFGGMKIGDIDVDRLWGNLARHGRDAERALLDQKFSDAAISMQRKYMTSLITAEAIKLRKEQTAFDRAAKQYGKSVVPSADPHYTPYIQDILQRVGKKVQRSNEDILHDIEGRETGSLEEFVKEKTNSLRIMPVWEQLFDTSWRKNLDDLTVDEFRGVHGTVKTMVFNARDELKIIKQGEEADFAVVKEELINNIQQNVGKELVYGEKGYRAKGATGFAGKALLTYGVQHVQMENLLNRFDGFDSKGPWNQYVMRDLIHDAGQVDATKKEFARRLKELGNPKDVGKSIDNTLFRDPGSQVPFGFTRKNLLAIMLNTGTESNLAKLAKGYDIDPQQVMDWVHQHATSEDWNYVKGVWDLFTDLKARSDKMYRSLSGGVAAKSIPGRPIETPFGTVEGGYYPIMYHGEFEGTSKKMMGEKDLLESNFAGIPSVAGYTKERTRYAAPIMLNMDALPGRMAQMIHDIELRPSIINAAKVFSDKGIRDAIDRHVGREYRDELIPYLRGVANSSNYFSRAQEIGGAVSEFFRQNMISTLIGLNPGTVMKHAPTAAMLSMREVGPMNFLKEVKGLFSINEETGQSNWNFAINTSVELQRRDRNWQETLYGASAGLTPGEKYMPLRQKIMEIGSKPVALSDMLSAVPTWLAKYKEQIGQGEDHGTAVYEADRAVRRAHGSTATTNRTGVQRNANPWLTSVYNFFSDVMNRQLETIWKAGESVNLAKEGEWKAASKMIPGLVASTFAYVVFPALVEQLVSPPAPNSKPNESWGHWAAHGLAFGLASSWIGTRDVANAMLSGRDPQIGLIGSFLQETTNMYRDFTKDHPFSREHIGKIIADGSSLVGAMTGLLPGQVGKVARFTHDTDIGLEHPKGPWSWLVGLRFGTTKGHATTFEHYKQGIHQ